MDQNYYLMVRLGSHKMKSLRELKTAAMELIAEDQRKQQAEKDAKLREEDKWLIENQATIVVNFLTEVENKIVEIMHRNFKTGTDHGHYCCERKRCYSDRIEVALDKAISEELESKGFRVKVSFSKPEKFNGDQTFSVYEIFWS